MNKIQNDQAPGEVFYGLHMAPGVAEYREPGCAPERIYINEETIKQMDPSFPGRPVFVHHVDEVDPTTVRYEAGGWVAESFYNECDGKHWVKFIAVSDEAKAKIRQGWKLSNAYKMINSSGGGQWHGVDYSKEITRGEYEHLAIVPNPRYSESIILTVDEFKKYCEDKKAEIKTLKNSKEGEQPMLSIFKRQKVENSTELETTMVVLPKCKKEMSILQIVNAIDEIETKRADGGMQPMADMDHHVMVGEEKMKLNDLVKKHMDCMNELKTMKEKYPPMDMGSESDLSLEKTKLNEEDEAKKKKEMEEKETKKNALDADIKKVEADLAAKKAELGKITFDVLKNAPNTKQTPSSEPTIIMNEDRVAVGKKRYGSKN